MGHRTTRVGEINRVRGVTISLALLPPNPANWSSLLASHLRVSDDFIANPENPPAQGEVQ